MRGDVELLTRSGAGAITRVALQLSPAMTEIHRGEPVAEVGEKGGDALREVGHLSAPVCKVTCERVWR
jgi:hypothetical protein